MNSTLGRVLFALSVVVPVIAAAQVQVVPGEFPEFRGTWTLDDAAGRGRIAGLPVARTLVIASTPTEISLKKDGAAPEVYRLDGTDTRDAGGADVTFRVIPVADALAFTTRRTRPSGTPNLAVGGRLVTNMITDAYSVSGDVLTIERQLSVVQTPPGVLVTLSDPRNNRQTLVYRRAPDVAAR